MGRHSKLKGRPKQAGSNLVISTRSSLPQYARDTVFRVTAKGRGYVSLQPQVYDAWTARYRKARYEGEIHISPEEFERNFKEMT